MNRPDSDMVFAGSVPQFYERHMVPLIFAPYAADALRLPFGDGEFDTVVCQFGAMFFPEKSRAFAEARRVLRPGGRFLFSVWDHIEHNAFAQTVTDALALEFAHDPPLFMARTPHGYHDMSIIARDLANGGWSHSAQFDTLTYRSRANSALDVAIAYCQGTPLRNEIETRAAGRLQEITERTAAVIAQRFGGGAVDGKIQAHVVTISH